MLARRAKILYMLYRFHMLRITTNPQCTPVFLDFIQEYKDAYKWLSLLSEKYISLFFLPRESEGEVKIWMHIIK